MRPHLLLLWVLAVLVMSPTAFARGVAGPETPRGVVGPAVADASLSGTNADADRTMQGRIGPRSHDLIAKWLRANPRRELTLHLDSRGGQALAGARLYEAIEAQGHVATDVGPGAVCLSACAYLWLAGRDRTVGDHAMLGFHSAFCEKSVDVCGVGFINQSLLDILARTEPALAQLVSHTGAMISGNRLLALASREDGHWAMRLFQPPP